ncbi:ABC transporter substrate-binding protein [Timonella senegalensis]|uniref:ABC transporter substrate-binding protein n=1 Tax=Timonella senegalensis TaxID=1465825 RepID=UPI0028B2276C|nr:extracellular solute-binding protein [Timonella senegalensis]
MKFKKTMAVSATAALALSLAACGSDDKGGNEGTGSGSGEKAQITWDMWAGSDDDIAALEATLKIAQEENPDIDIKLQHAPWNDYFTKLTANLSSGKAACVTSMNGQRLSGYADAFMELTPEDMATAGIKESDFTAGSLDIMSSGGKVLGIPYDVATMMVFYNKDQIEKTGAPAPKLGWTKADMEATLAKAGDDKMKAFGMGMAEFQWLALPISVSGVQPVTADGKLDLTNPAFVDAATWYGSFVEKGWADQAPSASETGWGESEYQAGNAALAVDGTWNAVSYLNNESGFKAGMVDLPAGDSGKNLGLVLGSGYGIAKNCENKEAALKVLGSLVGKAAQDSMASSGRSYPARVESQPLYFEALDASVRDEVKGAFDAAFANVAGQNTNAEWTKISETFPNNLVSGYTGAPSMADMLKATQDQFAK